MMFAMVLVQAREIAHAGKKHIESIGETWQPCQEKDRRKRRPQVKIETVGKKTT